METERLLPEETDHGDEPAESTPKQQPYEVSHRVRLYICLFVLKFLTQFIQGLLELPLLRLVEYAVCRSYSTRSTGMVGEETCKTPAVQDELAFIMGYKWAFDAIPGTNLTNGFRPSLRLTSIEGFSQRSCTDRLLTRKDENLF